MDILTATQRSYCMSRIRGKDTRPEVQLRKALWALGIRYRLESKLKGRPDLVLARIKVAVFVDGCFWHCCPKHFTMPRTRRAFWKNKITGNCERDRAVDVALRRAGWLVLRIWEHEVTSNLPRVCGRLVRAFDARAQRQMPHQKGAR
ncbi:MAG: very short patch repair endonuclease [Betaproteobacteria bacterium]